MDNQSEPVKAYLRGVWGIASKFLTCAVLVVIGVVVVLFGIGLWVALTL